MLQLDVSDATNKEKSLAKGVIGGRPSRSRYVLPLTQAVNSSRVRCPMTAMTVTSIQSYCSRNFELLDIEVVLKKRNSKLMNL